MPLNRNCGAKIQQSFDICKLYGKILSKKCVFLDFQMILCISTVQISKKQAIFGNFPQKLRNYPKLFKIFKMDIFVKIYTDL